MDGKGDEHSTELLSRIMADYNAMFGTSYSIENFDAYRKDITKRIVYRYFEYDIETSIHELLTYIYGEKLFKERKPEQKEFVHCYRFNG